MGAYGKFTAACMLGATLGSMAYGAALAADITILTNQGATPGVKELATAFAKKSGHNVTVVQAEDAELERRLANGTADLITGRTQIGQGTARLLEMNDDDRRELRRLRLG